MDHTYQIKMRTAFLAMMGVAFLAVVPAVALGGWVGDTMCACPGMAKPLGNNATCEDACYGSRSSSSGSPSPSYDYGAAQRAQEAAAEAERRQLQQAEADLIERERQAEIKRQKDAEFTRDRDVAANSLKGSSGAAMSQLKGLSGTDDFGLKGSGFDTGNGGLKELKGSNNFELKGSSQPVLHGDTSVVDARNVVSGLDIATENAIAKAYANAPPGVSDRVRKGFQAVMESDWKVAKAWFADALNRDPGNLGLQRLVALADYSQQHVQRSINGKPFTDEDIPADADPQTYAMTSTKIHSQEAWSKFLFPDGVHLRQSKPAKSVTPNGNQVQSPEDADIEFLFGPPEAAPAPASKPTPTFIIGKKGQLIQVPENSDQKSQTYTKGKDGKLIPLPQPSEAHLMFPGNSSAITSKTVVGAGKTK